MERTGAMFFIEEEAVTGTQILFPGGKNPEGSSNLYLLASNPVMEKLWPLNFICKVAATRFVLVIHCLHGAWHSSPT